MMTKQQAQRLAEQVIGYSKLPECEVSVNGSENVFIRFANNGITTSGYVVNQSLSVSVTTEDKRTGSATISEFSEEALRSGVAQAEMTARTSRPDPEHMPSLGPQKYPELKNFDTPTASARGDALIHHVKAIIDRARSKSLVSAGLIQKASRASAVANKAGLFGYHESTEASLTDTVRNRAGTSSGWASQTSNAIKDLNGEEAGNIAVEKCARGVEKRKLEPGKYTVILEPAAVSDLVGFLGWSFDARSAEQGRSFLSRKGKQGETLVEEKLFPDIVTLRSDPFDPRFSATPWGPSLLPNDRTAWIEKGVVKNLFYDRFWAGKAGHKPTPSPVNLTLKGQDHSLADLITSVDKGLLVTRFWYIRFLQPQTLQLTGLTRDGVFLVENGRITSPVMNFRWNESPVRVLQNAKMVGRSVCTVGAEAGSSIVPPLVAADFNFASISDAV